MNLWILYYKSNYMYLIKRQLNSSRKRAFFCNVFNRDFNSNGIKYIYVLIKPWPGLNMTSEFSLSWLCNLLMIIASIWFRFLCVTRYYSNLSIKKKIKDDIFRYFILLFFLPSIFQLFKDLNCLYIEHRKTSFQIQRMMKCNDGDLWLYKAFKLI